MYGFDCDLWQKLEKKERPIVLYGTGNGADKIIFELEKRGIEYDGIFASDNFVRERYFHGMKVESLSDIVARLGDNLTVVLCFGSSKSDVLDNIEALSEKFDLVIPDVPLYGGELFTLDFLKRNEDIILSARDLFDDDSKSLFDDAVAFRITGDIKYLSSTETLQEALLKLAKRKTVWTALDVGAYNGDTAEILSLMPDIESVIAVEGDRKTFEKLKLKACEISLKSGIPVVCENFAASDTERISTYSQSGSRGAGLGGKNRRARTVEVSQKPIDLLNIPLVDLLKLDVEGDELKAIKGCADTVNRSKSALAVSLYHRTNDLFELPLFLKNTFPHLSRFSLTRPRCIPLWDLVAICD